MLKTLLNVALPAMVILVFSTMMDLMNMVFIGTSNDAAKIAAIGLGNMFNNIFCQSIILGLNGSIATLGSQAFGAKNVRKVGIILNKGRFIVFVAFIPMTALMVNCERILVLIDQDPEASHYA